jgi:hypothetical protein
VADALGRFTHILRMMGCAMTDASNCKGQAASLTTDVELA